MMSRSLTRWLRRMRTSYLDWRFGTIDLSASLGKRGEQAAVRLLRQSGYRIVGTSVSDRGGEIDVIALDGKTIVFVEVKTYATSKPGHPAERVDEEKQRRVTRAALRFLKRRRLLNQRVRFDVVAVFWPDETPQPQKMQHFVAAFDATGEYEFY